MSVSGPIGRTPRQVAGPGVDDADEDTVDAEGAVAVDDLPPDRDRAPEPDPVTEPEGTTDPEAVGEPDPAPDLEPVADVGPDEDPERDPVVAPDAEPEPELQLDPEPDPEPGLDAEPEPDPEARLDTELVPEPEVELVPEADLEPDPELEPEPVGAVAAAPGDGFMGDTRELRRRWEHVQASFVDDPRLAVEQADEMVSVAVAALQAQVEQRREDLAETWRAGQQASTDALLDAFQRYRDLFDGVLST